MSGDVQVLARIDSARFYERPGSYRAEVRSWLLANGIDPWEVSCSRDVQVVVLDGPAVVYERVPRDRTEEPRVVHSLLRVPLPEHLADPT